MKCMICLNGAFSISDNSGRILSLGAKQQAIVATLATARDGVRTRAWLQSMLWGSFAPAQASASLRNALSSIRRTLGPDLADIIQGNRERVWLVLDAVTVRRDAADSEFL